MSDSTTNLDPRKFWDDFMRQRPYAEGHHVLTAYAAALAAQSHEKVHQAYGYGYQMGASNYIGRPDSQEDMDQAKVESWELNKDKVLAGEKPSLEEDNEYSGFPI
jgi:hypothetical protein